MSDPDFHPELDMTDFTPEQTVRVLEYLGKVSLLERMDELARLAQGAREYRLQTVQDFQLFVGIRMLDLAGKYINERNV